MVFGSRPVLWERAGLVGIVQYLPAGGSETGSPRRCAAGSAGNNYFVIISGASG
jgi:hypothetical protein